jgi:hypothetical protein
VFKNPKFINSKLAFSSIPGHVCLALLTFSNKTELKVKTLFSLLILIFFTSSAAFTQGIGINQTGAAAHKAAILDVSSTQKGFLPPRMTTAQRDSIANPADGLVIFNLTEGCLNYFFGGLWYEWKAKITYPAGTVLCNATPTAVVEVLNPATGKTWMDRNLGASRAATSSIDSAAYGDLYQWGRRADGHQCRNAAITNILSSTDQPAHGNFITVNSGDYDWRSPQNNQLWQGVKGINNPCPSGYRIPTEAELNEERLQRKYTKEILGIRERRFITQVKM